MPPGVQAAVRAGADAIGLNIVAGTPRALSVAEGAELAAVARAAAPSDRARPRIVLVTADASADLLEEAVAAVDPDAIQFSGTEAPDRVLAAPRPAWRTLHVAAGRRWRRAAPQTSSGPRGRCSRVASNAS